MSAIDEIRSEIARLERDRERCEMAWIPESQRRWTLADIDNEIEHLECELDFVIRTMEEEFQ